MSSLPLATLTAPPAGRSLHLTQLRVLSAVAVRGADPRACLAPPDQTTAPAAGSCARCRFTPLGAFPVRARVLQASRSKGKAAQCSSEPRVPQLVRAAEEALPAARRRQRCSLAPPTGISPALGGKQHSSLKLSGNGAWRLASGNLIASLTATDKYSPCQEVALYGTDS